MSDNTLLLNASFEPLKVIPIRRAIVLILADKADVVSADEQTLFRSPSVSIAAPSVIRLRRFVKVPYRTTVRLNRKSLIARDRGNCAYCGDRGNTIDHVLPRARGGAHDWMNVVCACYSCNSKKSDKLIDELGWKLRYKPFVPREWSWLVVGLATNPDWQPWLPVIA